MQTKLELSVALSVGLTVTLLGAASLWYLTGGLRWFTSEAWRRAEIAAAPRPLPDVALQDQHGRTWKLHDLCGKVLLVDFVYTQCPTVCRALGATSAQLAQRLAEPAELGKVAVLSISFDPARDSPARMGAYKRSLEAASTSWTMARPTTDPRELLNAFGVVVIPDGSGGFEHNAALHAVDRSCRIARVFDVDEVDHAEQWVRAQL